MYQDTITTFGLPALNDRFEMLRQLGNVFVVQPDILKSYLNESYLARVENRWLRAYVMQRTDFGDYSRKWWDDILGDGAAASGVMSNGALSNGDKGPSGGEKASSLLGGLMRDLGETMHLREERDRPLSMSQAPASAHAV